MLSLVFTLFVVSKRQGVQMMMMNRYIIECCGSVGARRRVRWNTLLNTSLNELLDTGRGGFERCADVAEYTQSTVCGVVGVIRATRIIWSYQLPNTVGTPI